MRVLYLNADPGIPVLGHKGASVHVRELTRALVRAGIEVVVAAPRVEPEGGDVIADGADLRAISAVLPRSSPTEADVRAAMDVQAAEVLALARDRGAEAIYERFSLFSDAGVRAARALGIPHALEVNAPLREEASRFRSLPHAQLAALIERDVLEATGRVLVVSAPLVERVVAAGARPEMVEVLPNGVAADVPLATPGPASDSLTVGFAGSLKAWHGVEVLLEATGLAAAEAPGIRLEVVGQGPLTDLLSESTLGERLHYVGALSHPATLARIATWDAGAAPYLPLEDFYFSPLKVLEYMAAGVCAVASALGELPDLLGAGERGVLVRPGDATDLASALVELARDPGRRARMGRAARAHVVAHRGWDVNAGRVLAALAPAAVTR
jgi:glycosyltransferase involved in cell wall biosynthesis